VTRFTPLWLQAGSYAASVDRRLIGALYPDARSSGCALTATGAMDIQVSPGSVAVPLVGGVGSVLCVSDDVETVTLPPAPGAGVDRIDLVICQARGADIDGGANDDFLYTSVQGAPTAPPAVAPPVPANAVALGSVYLVGGSAAVDPAKITDLRPGALAVPAVAAPVTVHAKMYRQAAMNISSAAQVAPFDTADTLNGNVNTPGVISGLNTANARFIIPIDGRYLFAAMLNASPPANSMTLYCNMRKNGQSTVGSAGAPWIAGQAQWGQGPTAAAGVVCRAGDYLEVVWQTNSATAAPIQGGAGQSWATVDYLGPVPT
jgi:hypothetical protein